jgi:DNA-binding MarR family transcriptional regulator
VTTEAVVPLLDPAIGQPTRLAVVAFLAGCAEAEFKAVRDRLDLTDSTLSKTMSALEAAEYVKVRKGYVGKRPRTWLALTADGRRKLAGHVAALQQIADQAKNNGARLK